MQLFKDPFKKKYGLRDYTNINSGAVFYGCYHQADYTKINQHKGYKIILWRGTDAQLLPSGDTVKADKHIAASLSVQNTLRAKGIQSEVLPITPTTLDIKNQRRGCYVYWYYGNDPYKYGDAIVRDLEKLLPPHIVILKANSKTYNREQLMNVYRESFIGLRLNQHDGLPNTVLEMGLMGRNCIYNGVTPNAINYGGVMDIYFRILEEYEKRNDCNKHISEAMQNYLKPTTEWLHY